MVESTETPRITIEKLFFSRTDHRGVIQGANGVFADVSNYQMSEMLGAPHKIVRHKHMPRAVFHLMWDRLKSGRPIGAYVKNLTSDGQHYWVFAFVSPVEGGYLSIRLKPLSGLLRKIEAIYTRLCKGEDDDGLGPEKGIEALLTELSEIGFASYEAFMSNALSEEIRAREEALNRVPVQSLSRLRRLSELTSTIETEARTVAQVFRSTDQIPYNMRLQAGRMEGSDGPISVISENHRQMSFAIEDDLKRFREKASLGAELITGAAFVAGAAYLAEEMAKQFDGEPMVEGIDRDSEKALLIQLARSYSADTRSAVSRVVESATELGRLCRDMRRVVSGLEMTRIMCKIERARANGDTEGLDEIVSRLVVAEEKLSRALSEIEAAVRGALDETETLTKIEAAA